MVSKTVALKMAQAKALTVVCVPNSLVSGHPRYVRGFPKGV